MMRIALAALCAAVLCSSAEAQSLLGVAPSTQTTSVRGTNPPPPFLPAGGIAQTPPPPYVPSNQPEAIVQYGNTFHDTGLARLQRELLDAYIRHARGPQAFPLNESNLKALTMARQRWHARRTERSLIYRDMDGAVAAFAEAYREAWRLELKTPEQQAAHFRYDEAVKDMWKLARDPLAPFDRRLAEFYAAFWAQEVQYANQTEREIARVLADVYKAQVATHTNNRASR